MSGLSVYSPADERKAIVAFLRLLAADNRMAANLTRKAHAKQDHAKAADLLAAIANAVARGAHLGGEP